MTEDEAVQRAVEIALMAGGQYDAGWRGRVLAALPFAAAALRPEQEHQKASDEISHAREVVGAKSFFTTYLSHSLEKSSQRNVVITKSDNSDEPEHLRTHRVDEPMGALMAERLSGLKAGDKLLVFRHQDRLDAKRTVRMLVHFEVLSSGAQRSPLPRVSADAEAGDTARSPAQPPRDDARRPSGDVRKPDEHLDREKVASEKADGAFEVLDLYNKMDNKQRLMFANLCRDEGIIRFMDPESPHERHRVKVIAEGILDPF